MFSSDQPENTELEWTDSHCHLDDQRLGSDKEALIASCRSAGLHRMICSSVDVASAEKLMWLANRHAEVWFAAGVHPWFLEGKKDSQIAESLSKFLKDVGDHPKLVGLGEMGLDGGIRTPMDIQDPCLRVQLQLASDNRLPVILHVRKAISETLSILDQESFTEGGVVHAFSGSIQQGEAFIERGFKLGIGGAMTWHNARRLRNVIRQLPLSEMVLETDAPDMPPDWIAEGEHNSPVQVPKIATYLAELKAESLQDVNHSTEQAVNEVFGFVEI